MAAKKKIVMQQHEMSRNVHNMHFALFIVSGCIFCADFNDENHFQLPQKLKKFDQNIMWKFVL